MHTFVGCISIHPPGLTAPLAELKAAYIHLAFNPDQFLSHCLWEVLLQYVTTTTILHHGNDVLRTLGIYWVSAKLLDFVPKPKTFHQNRIFFSHVQWVFNMLFWQTLWLPCECLLLSELWISLSPSELPLVVWLFFWLMPSLPCHWPLVDGLF